jgi:hypothetical protein
MAALRRFVIEHDERWLFTVSYTALAVVLSAQVSLFWLLMVVAVHVAFETVRQRHLYPGCAVVRRVLWATKLDLAFIVFSLALSLYLDTLLGVAGLGGLARLGIRAGSGWTRALRAALLSVDDAARVAAGAAARLTGRAAAEEESGALDLPPWAAWRAGDHVAIWLALACAVSIACAPLVLDHHPWPVVVSMLRRELDPWP